MPATVTNNAVDLRNKLNDAFDLGELRSLCFNLSIDIENLPGQVKVEKIESLILHCTRNQQLPALLTQLKALRPNIDWPQPSAAEALVGWESPTGLAGIAPSTLERQTILLNKVKDYWITGVLNKTVRQNIMITLKETEEGSAVDSPWPSTAASGAEIGEEKSIAEIFDSAHRSLLILGQAGSGKTIKLLELAQALIAERDRDPHRPVPVVLTLVAWEAQRLELADWIVEELVTKYHIPRKYGRDWLENDDLILLLDGLDEISPRPREECIKAINRFRETQGFTGLAVTSRTEDYKKMDTLLRLDDAISLQPLTPVQIDTYLQTAGHPLAPLRNALRQDVTLLNLARSPLILNVMCIVYSGREDLPEILSETETWSGGRRATLRDELFLAFIGQVFEQPKAVAPWDNEQTKSKLSWLAVQMKRHNQTVFQIDQLQPSWLPSANWRISYMLFTRTVWGLMTGIFIWLFLLPVIIVPINGLIGLLVGIWQAYRFESSYQEAGDEQIRPPRSWGSTIALSLVSAVLVSAALYLVGGELGLVFYAGLLNGAVTVISLYFSLGSSYWDDIHTAESLGFSISGFLRGILPGYGIGLILGLAGGYALDFSVVQQWRLGFESALLWGLYFGLQPRRLETRTSPYQPAILTLRNSLLAALIFGLSYGLLVTVWWGWTLGILRFLQFGLGAGFLYGGFDLFKFYTLRVWLWLSFKVPFNLVRFLDYVVELGLMRPVGNGYQFFHRLLQEHFVSVGLANHIDRSLRY